MFTKTSFRAVPLLAGLLLLIGCSSLLGNFVTGSGNPVTQEFDFSDFTEVSIENAFAGTITRGDDYRVVAAYVAAGLGVALVPELALPSHVGRNENLAVVPLRGPDLSREIVLLTAPTLDESIVGLMARTAVAQHSRMLPGGSP